MSSRPPAELERALDDLRADLAWPATPNLAPAVSARLAGARRPRRSRGVALPRPVPVVAVAAVLALLTLLAIPATRSAIAGLLGVAGIEIRFGDDPPAEPGRRSSHLGTAVSLTEARAAVAYDLEVPALGPPDGVWLDRRVPGGAVTLEYRDGSVLWTQFRGGLDSELIRKVLGPGTRLEEVTVDGGTGYWISGAEHSVLYLTPSGDVREDRARVAGNTLVWEVGGVTYRLEADVGRGEALRIARSAGSP